MASKWSGGRGDSLARGALYIMSAQGTLLIAGFAVHAYLGRCLGPELYGTFGVIMALLAWFEVSLTAAFPYAIRKFGAEDKSRLMYVAKSALLGQYLFTLVIVALVQIFASHIAAILGDPELTLLIRIASLDIPVYAAYYCYLGVLNGESRFKQQAIAAMTYSGFKLVTVVGLVVIGYGVKGALIGNAMASVAGLAMARVLSGPIRSEETFPLRKMTSYVTGTVFLAVLFTLLMNLDVLIIKAIVHNGVAVGTYVAASTLARAPFYLFLAIANVTLPSLSRALAGNNRELVSKYTKQSFRLHLMMLMPLTAVTSALSTGVVALVYKTGYESAGTALSILIFAFMLWGLLNGVFNLMVADQNTHFPVILTLILIGLMFLMSFALTRIWGITGAAVSALVVGGSGLIIAGTVALRRFGALISAVSFIRILLASMASYWFASLFNAAGISAVGSAVLSFMVYGLILVVAGELTRLDLIKVI